MFSTKSLKALATFAAIAVLFLAGPTFAADDMKADPALVAVANGPQRSDANKARDQYRHPVETLTFFGLKADMTVVELWPFGGWYTEILAPYLKEHGRLYGANVGADIQGLGRYRTAFENKLASDKVLFDKVATTELGVAETDLAPAGTADMVVTFRNIHNWDQSGLTEKVFDRVYKALKPGGVFGVVEHRADPGKEDKEPGYVSEDGVIKRAKAAGFELAAKSNVNANPKDTKDYPGGVWTLPPNYRSGKDREKYDAIGESDRFTLKFVKPAN